MPRIAKLRDKGGYWTTDAGGRTTRFGKVGEVPYSVALQSFREYLAMPPLRIIPAQEETLTVNAMADQFLAWVLTNRGQKAHEERSRHIARFRQICGDLPADQVRVKHLDSLMTNLAAKHFASDYLQKHATSIQAMFNRAGKQGWIPPSLRPFDNFEPIRKLHKTLTEAKLPTDEEVKKLFLAADSALFGQMGDLVRLYHATGARTGELVAVRAGDFQRINRQIILANHKRSHTLREAVPRTISLNPVAYEIMLRRTEGLPPNGIIFPRIRDGKAHNARDMAKRFEVIRRRAGVRTEITVYSFRHLFISEMLMAGIDVLLVARMAGTSVKMIETVYGHFRVQSFMDAQAKLDAARANRGI